VVEDLEAGYGAVRVLHGVSISVEDGESVVLTADQVEAPQHVRYAWAAVPSASLRNGAGLPASPFRRTVPGGSR